MKRVAIIGGGPAGLCAAKHLIHNKQYGGVQYEPIIFEQQGEVGGTWIYRDIDKNDTDNVKGFSSIYKNLLTNLPKQAMCYPDFPFADDTPTFPHHTQVLKYVKDYATHFNLYPHIKFNTRVISVSPINPDSSEDDESEKRFIKWQVKYCDLISQEESTNIFDVVLVCSGHYSIPSMPDIKGMEHFKGEILHSHYYRDPINYSGKVAIVFGSGPSGTDIMSELSNVCPMVYFCHRDGEKPSKWKHKPNIVELPSISHILPSGDVVFMNGKKVHADVIIVCTGYLYDYSFLSKDCNILLPHGNRVVMPTYKHLFHTQYPSLAFIGLPWKCAPMPVMHQQCAYLMSVLSGATVLPSENEMKKETDEELENIVQNGEPERYFHKMGPKQFEYVEELSKLSGYTPNPKVMETLYQQNSKARREDLYNYKSRVYKVIDDNEFLIVE